jgi:fluoroacetyl-CoA thioesterase
MLHEVTEADTAAAVGSGDVPVLATPRLLAWMEAATLESAVHHVGPGQTTVGTGIRIEHRRPTKVGDVVDVVAELASAPTGTRVTFSVRATDGAGEVVASGEIDRVIVDRDRFLSRVHDPATDR